jgi:hypothetical protein
MRSEKKKRKTMLSVLAAEYRAYSEEELRILIERVPSEKARASAAPLRWMLVGLLAMVAAAQVVVGLGAMHDDRLLGGAALGGAVLIAWLLYGVLTYSHEGYVNCALLLGLGFARAILRQDYGNVSIASVVIAIVVAALALACRSKLFPKLTWQGRLNHAD